MKISRWMCALALSAGMASISFGQITGKVTVSGKIPDMPEITAIKLVPGCAAQHKDPVYAENIVAGDKGELANAVVSIKTPDGKTLGKPADEKTPPVELDQKGCVYSPHVVAVQVGQPMVVKNSDPFLHNVHTLPVDNDATNFAQPMVGKKKLEPYKTAEVIKVKCDVHAWMYGWIVVLDNPYFSVTSADEKSMGTFSIDTKGLPDGEYTLVIWHESFKPQEQKIKVVDGKAQADFTLDMGKDFKGEIAK